MTGSKLQKLPKGAKLRFKKSFRDWHKKINAWEWCAVYGGDRMEKESQALDYLFHKVIALGKEDSVKFDFFRADVGDRKPGATVTVKFGPYTDKVIVAAEDLELVR